MVLSGEFTDNKAQGKGPVFSAISQFNGNVTIMNSSMYVIALCRPSSLTLL